MGHRGHVEQIALDRKCGLTWDALTKVSSVANNLMIEKLLVTDRAGSSTEHYNVVEVRTM